MFKPIHREQQNTAIRLVPFHLRCGILYRNLSHPLQEMQVKMLRLDRWPMHLPPGYQGPLLGPPSPSWWPRPGRLLLRDAQGMFRNRRVLKKAVAVHFQIPSRWPKQ